jgi:hypothetical protein
VNLGPGERAALRELPTKLSEAVTANSGAEALRRLFPPAYPSDEEAESEFRRFIGQELTASKLEALETLSKTAEKTELSEGEATAWLRALNDIRLWLGTLLDIKEDDAGELDDPPHALYHVLTWLQSLLVDAISGG